MRILITGGGGFIGSRLGRLASERGHEPLLLCRSAPPPDAPGAAFPWSLGEPIPPEALRGVECAVHLAHDFGGEEGARRTVEGTLAAAAELRAAGVGRQLLFSSCSAGEHATSRYGRCKYALERAVAAWPDVVVVRPGLVTGEGGIHGRIARWARLLPVVPLPDGGRDEVAVIPVERLCRETLALAESPRVPAEANLFERRLVPLRTLVLEAAAAAGKRPLILPVPSALLLAALRGAEALRIPLPVKADNLEGFLANRELRHESTLREETP